MSSFLCCARRYNAQVCRLGAVLWRPECSICVGIIVHPWASVFARPAVCTRTACSIATQRQSSRVVSFPEGHIKVCHVGMETAPMGWYLGVTAAVRAVKVVQVGMV